MEPDDEIAEDDQVDVTVAAKLNCARDVNVEALRKRLITAILKDPDVDEVATIEVTKE